MKPRRLFAIPGGETATNPEPYAALVNCIEEYLEINEDFVGDLDGDPSQRGMLIDTEVGKGTIVILDGAYRIVLQSPAKLGRNNVTYHECNIIDVDRVAAINESYTLKVTKDESGPLTKIVTRETNHNVEELDKKSTNGLEWLLTDGRSVAYRDEEQATYNN